MEQQTGFTKEHWQSLKDIGRFRYHKTYDEYLSAREKEKDNKQFTAYNPNAKSVSGSVKGVWVKKLINKKEWSIKYANYDSYCNLGDGLDLDTCYIAFLVVPNIKNSLINMTEEDYFAEHNLMRLSDYEMEVVNNYRSANNIGPRPFKPETEKPKEDEYGFQKGMVF